MTESTTPAEWFPPERGPVLVIGHAGSVFTRHLAALWRSMGLDARILTRRWNGDRIVSNGIPVIVTTDTENSARRTTYDTIERVASDRLKRASLESRRHATRMPWGRKGPTGRC